MRIGVTGATGFLGRYIVAQLGRRGHHCRCWYRLSKRPERVPDAAGLAHLDPGALGDPEAGGAPLKGATPSSMPRIRPPRTRFAGERGRPRPLRRYQCRGHHSPDRRVRGRPAVRLHLDLRGTREDPRRPAPRRNASPLADESLRPHKAAIEAFVHSYGFGQGYEICALRPTGIYGLAHPAPRSKWFDLIRAVARR